MKHKMISFYLLVFVFVLSSVTMVGAKTTDYTVPTKDQCASPAKTLFITGNAPNVYNESTLNVPVNACVKITFKNIDVIEHTFTVDANATYNITYFNIYTTGGQTASSNFWTGNANATIQFYCAVPQHKADGMYGSMIIGTGGNSSSSSSPSSPGFEVFSVFLSLGVIFTFTKIYKRRR